MPEVEPSPAAILLALTALGVFPDACRFYQRTAPELSEVGRRELLSALLNLAGALHGTSLLTPAEVAAAAPAISALGRWLAPRSVPAPP